MRRLLLTLTEPPERLGFRLRWSTFRRQHQAIAKRCHAAHRAHHQSHSRHRPSVQVPGAIPLDLTDERWARIAPLLPPQKPATGRPANDQRTLLAGIFWVVRTGASWRELPEYFGSWQTVHSRYQRWRTTGIWQQILDSVQDADDPPV